MRVQGKNLRAFTVSLASFAEAPLRAAGSQSWVFNWTWKPPSEKARSASWSRLPRPEGSSTAACMAEGSSREGGSRLGEGVKPPRVVVSEGVGGDRDHVRKRLRKLRVGHLKPGDGELGAGDVGSGSRNGHELGTGAVGGARSGWNEDGRTGGQDGHELGTGAMGGARSGREREKLAWALGLSLRKRERSVRSVMNGRKERKWWSSINIPSRTSVSKELCEAPRDPGRRLPSLDHSRSRLLPLEYARSLDLGATRDEAVRGTGDEAGAWDAAGRQVLEASEQRRGLCLRTEPGGRAGLSGALCHGELVVEA